MEQSKFLSNSDMAIALLREILSDLLIFGVQNYAGGKFYIKTRFVYSNIKNATF